MLEDREDTLIGLSARQRVSRKPRTAPFAEPLPFVTGGRPPATAGYNTRDRARDAVLRKKGHGPSGYVPPVRYRAGALEGLACLSWKYPLEDSPTEKALVGRGYNRLEKFYKTYRSPYAQSSLPAEGELAGFARELKEQTFTIESSLSVFNNRNAQVWMTSSDISPTRKRQVKSLGLSSSGNRADVEGFGDAPLSPGRRAMLLSRSAYVQGAPPYTTLISSHHPGGTTLAASQSSLRSPRNQRVRERDDDRRMEVNCFGAINIIKQNRVPRPQTTGKTRFGHGLEQPSEAQTLRRASDAPLQ